MNRENQYDIHKYYEIEIPGELDERVRRGLAMGNQLCKKQKMRSRVKKCAVAAAAVAVAGTFVVCNPVLAAKLPILGHVFEMLQGDYSYEGDYSTVAVPLQGETPVEGNGEASTQTDSAYVKESAGVTVSLSEVYCNDQAIYLAMTMESEEEFPDTLTDESGKVTMQLETAETYSFNPMVQHGLRQVEGKMLDKNTFAGIMRISFDEVNVDDSRFVAAMEKEEDVQNEDITDAEAFEQLADANNAEDLIVEVEVPESFTMNLSISQIIGFKAEPETPDWGKTEEELEAMSDAEWEQFMKENCPVDYFDFPNRYTDYWYDGAWNYELELSVDNSKTQVQEVNTTNENGVGIASVEKTPFEVKLNEIYPDGGYDYFPVALDANGELLTTGMEGSVNILAIQDRDVSTVYIYICDYDEYMDEIKGYYYSDDYEQKKAEKSYKELLDERAVYATEVHFE